VTGAKTSKNSYRKKEIEMDDPPTASNDATIEIDDNVEVAVYEKKKKKRNRRHQSAINKKSPINSIENALDEKEIESSPHPSGNLPEINSKKKNYRVSKKLSSLNNDYNESIQIHIKKSLSPYNAEHSVDKLKHIKKGLKIKFKHAGGKKKN